MQHNPNSIDLMGTLKWRTKHIYLEISDGATTISFSESQSINESQSVKVNKVSLDLA